MAQTTTAASAAGNVRAELARAGLSATRAARDIGWSNSRMFRRLNGGIPFDVDELQVLSDYLNVPVETFLSTSRGAA